MAAPIEKADFVRATVESYSDLKKPDGSKYTVYNISVTDSQERVHVLQKRFNEFYDLYQKIRGTHTEVQGYKFPAKTALTLSKHDARVKESRCQKFNEFMKIVMSIKPTPPQILAWLEAEGHKDTSIFRDLQSRAYKDRPILLPAPDDTQQILDLMMKPTPFLKYGRQGNPHWRMFYLTSDRKKIVWSSKKLLGSGASEINVADIKHIDNSIRNAFERHTARVKELANVAMVIAYTLPGTTQQKKLEVICKHSETLRIWMLGIDYLISSMSTGSGMSSQKRESSATENLVADDEDEEDDGDESNLITASCHAYSWGAGGWGQLGQTDEPPTADGLDLVAPMVLTNPKKKMLAKYNVRTAACGGAHTVVLDRSTGAWVCGRSSICAEATGGPQRDHVLTLQNAELPSSSAVNAASLSPVENLYPPTELAVVACGEDHILAVSFSGRIFAVGSNFFGQLGDGTTVDRPTLTQVNGVLDDKRVYLVGAGQGFSAAVCRDKGGASSLYTWGTGDFGVLGHGDTESRSSPAKVEAITPYLKENVFAQIECGGYHMAALLKDSSSADASAPLAENASSSSTLLTWGSSACGQLGHGTFDDKHVPTPIEMLTGQKEVVQVACGASHSAAILNVTTNSRRFKGQLWTWGNGIPSTGQDDAAPSANPRFYNFTKRDANQNNVAVQISCGDNFTAVLDEDAKVTVIGLSPILGKACRHYLEPPKEDENKNTLDVESIAAGGTHVALVMAERHIR